ncbi:MAG: DedA family protein [Geobacteraceae bacterium]|nr:DedA family protein [Geobacteraceae bacterium]
MLHDRLHQPGYVTLFTVSFLASTLLPLGSEWLLVMMLVSGYEPLTTVAVATAGNYLGAVTSYLIGMFGGEWLIVTVLRVSPEQQERARNHYRRYGIFTLLFSWLPLVGDPLCLAGGVLRINFWLFTLLVASGKLVRYAVTAWIALRVSG